MSKSHYAFAVVTAHENRVGTFKIPGTRVFEDYEAADADFRNRNGLIGMRGKSVEAIVCMLVLPDSWSNSVIENGMIYELIKTATVIKIM